MSSQYALIIISAVVIVAFYNEAFFQKVNEAFPFDSSRKLFAVSIAILLLLVTILLLSLVANRWITKPLLIIFFMISALSSYFMVTYGLVVDSEMLRNALETDFSEALGLMNGAFAAYVIFFGLVPSIIVARWPVTRFSLYAEILAKCLVAFISLGGSLCLIWISSADYASFFREYKIIRYHVNPIYPIYSMASLAGEIGSARDEGQGLKNIASDSKMINLDHDNENGRPERELIIMVVGETARADHFALNGYLRDVNPELSKISNLVSFTHFSSCGTSTAVSVPCMFSHKGRRDYSSGNIDEYENALDILARHGVNILWRDNNSSSKGVAERVEFQDFRTTKNNPECDSECRDEGMLYQLDKYIDIHPQGDILIVLHQMGSHGPEYFKRYPPEFEFFQPVCKKNILGECSQEAVINAYDNAIRYTDHFLAKVIEFLTQYDEQFEAGMLYISDHGESLGENGVYLHGMPYMIAPKSQTEVASIIWAGKNFDYPIEDLRTNKAQALTHDAVFCTVLSLFEVATGLCSPSNEARLVSSKRFDDGK